MSYDKTEWQRKPYVLSFNYLGDYDGPIETQHRTYAGARAELDRRVKEDAKEIQSCGGYFARILVIESEERLDLGKG